jgi:hypothetical protein
VTGATGATGASGRAGNATIANFASSSSVQSANCLYYTELAGQGNGSCPGKTSGYSSSVELAGPTPAGGAIVSDLYADTSAVPTGKETALVAVIDNTTGLTLLSCPITSSSKSSCSNTAASGPVAAGDYIEVRVSASNSSAHYIGQWRVRFRY